MYELIIKILKDLNISFEELNHEQTNSCEHSAELREKAWFTWIWSKNIIFHAKWNFYLVTTIWTKDIKARIFKKDFWTKDIRFATSQEITQIWLWVIWSIAPFWYENIDIPIFVDNEIFNYEFFMFNPWIPTKTIRIKTTDLKDIYAFLKNPVSFFSTVE